MNFWRLSLLVLVSMPAWAINPCDLIAHAMIKEIDNPGELQLAKIAQGIGYYPTSDMGGYDDDGHLLTLHRMELKKEPKTKKYVLVNTTVFHGPNAAPPVKRTVTHPDLVRNLRDKGVVAFALPPGLFSYIPDGKGTMEIADTGDKTKQVDYTMTTLPTKTVGTIEYHNVRLVHFIDEREETIAGDPPTVVTTTSFINMFFAPERGMVRYESASTIQTQKGDDSKITVGNTAINYLPFGPGSYEAGVFAENGVPVK